MKRKFLYLFLLGLWLVSCQKIVHLNLNTSAPETVIEGIVNDSAQNNSVIISRSVGFYQDNIFPSVLNAKVTISDNTGFTDSLTENSPGIYITHLLRGIPGNTYTLSVHMGDTVYSAVSTMPGRVPLDSVTFSQNSGFRRQTITTLVNFQDPPGQKNYYQFNLFINNVQFTKEIFVFDDRLSDGKYIQLNLRTDSAYIQSGDLVLVQMNCVDENTYNYFSQLRQAISTGTFNTDASPANPATNLAGGAFGFFSAQETDSKSAIVP
ncbi:MAG TPA: DUF4249 domain-containing protein [Puia sp.]|nr:DUF4249 domain-containing protein [Puia sp.]